MSHQSIFPSRQVHLVSTSGMPVLNGDTKADLTFFFNSPIVEVPSSYDIILGCVSASIPHVWTNITKDNNTFSIAYTNMAYNQSLLTTEIVPYMSSLMTITLPIGNYNITQIIDALNKGITYFTFSYNPNTHLVSIAMKTDSPGYLWMLDGGYYGFQIVDTSMSVLLGFTTKSVLANRDVIPITCESLSSTKPMNLIRTTSVFVECPDLINESFDSRIQSQSGVICRIPVSGSPGNLLTWTNTLGTTSKLSLKQINHIRIRLLDDDRNVIDTRGYTWVVTLQFSVKEATSFIEGDWIQRNQNVM